ncbi:hypothetical protein AtDm6_1190 [Acetobacter tropicalis]|uniref:Uncharacterized protein n=1 Tax=Acetobacter tropicalis TaxID=104102 RepID=A0A094YST6_9PROT|nr:hypothetical protein AtDm6_1190 [Acetobacter tropicalis]
MKETAQNMRFKPQRQGENRYRTSMTKLPSASRQTLHQTDLVAF